MVNVTCPAGSRCGLTRAGGRIISCGGGRWVRWVRWDWDPWVVVDIDGYMRESERRVGSCHVGVVVELALYIYLMSSIQCGVQCGLTNIRSVRSGFLMLVGLALTAKCNVLSLKHHGGGGCLYHIHNGNNPCRSIETAASSKTDPLVIRYCSQ